MHGARYPNLYFLTLERFDNRSSTPLLEKVFPLSDIFDYAVI